MYFTKIVPSIAFATSALLITGLPAFGKRTNCMRLKCPEIRTGLYWKGEKGAIPLDLVTLRDETMKNLNPFDTEDRIAYEKQGAPNTATQQQVWSNVMIWRAPQYRISCNSATGACNDFFYETDVGSGIMMNATASGCTLDTGKKDDPYVRC